MILEEQDNQGTPATPEPSFYDKVDALTPQPASKKSFYDRVDELGSKPEAPINWTAQEASKRNPDTAARVVRLARQFKYPERFVEQNLPRLEQLEKDGEFKTEDLVNNSPKLSQLIADSGPNVAAVALKDMPNLQKLEMLYTRPMDLWPMSDEVIQEKARKDAKMRAAQDWGKPVGVDEFGREIPSMFSSQQQMEDAYYQSSLDFRKAQEKYISGYGEIGSLEALAHRGRENPFFWAPFGGDIVDAAKMGELYVAGKAQREGTATPEQIELLQDYARVEKAAQHRGTSFVGKLSESLASLPAFAGELALTGGVYNAAEGAVFKGGKKAAELFMKGAFNQALESGFAKSAGKKVAAMAVGAAAEALPARGIHAIGEELKTAVNTDQNLDLSKAAWDTLVRSYADVLSAKSTELLQPFSNKLFQAIVKNDSGATLTMVQDQLRKGGIGGFLGMVGQGEVAKLVNAAGGVAPYQAPTGEDIALAALTGGIPHALAMASDVTLGRSEIYKAKLHAEAAVKRADLIRESSINEALPDHARELTDNLAKDGPNEFTYLPSKAFKEYWESKGVDPNQKARELGLKPDELSSALRSGADLTVKTADMDHVIGADKEATQFFSRESRSAPDVINLREAEEWQKRLADRQAAPHDARQEIVNQIVEQARGDKIRESVLRARLDQGSEPLLADPALLGLTDKQVTEVSKVIAEGQLHAEQTIRDKEIARRDKLKSDLYQKELQRQTEQATAEVNARPEHRVVADLQNGTLKGEAHPELGSPPKISREILKAEYPGIKLSDLPKGVTDGPGTIGVGVHPDTLAQMHGFNSGHDLLYSLMGLNKEKDIANLVNERMSAKFPGSLLDSELPQAAIDAIHNKHNAKLKQLTLQYIAENKLSALQDLNKVASRRAPSTAAVREGALKEIQGKPVGRLDPRIYLMAERQAAAEAMAALKKGNWEGLFDAKLQELEAHERYTAATEAIERNGKILSEWQSVPEKALFLKPETVEFGQQVKDLLRRIGVIAVSPRELEGKLPLDQWITEKETAGETNFEPIWIEPRFREEGFSSTFGDLTHGDIISLNDTIQQITHLARDRGMISTASKKVRLEAWKESLKASIEAEYPKLPLTGRTKNERGKLDNLKHAARLLDAINDRPESFFTLLDGGKIDGPMSEALFHPSAEAQNEANAMRAQFVNAIIKAKKAMPKEVQSRLYDRMEVPGVERPLSRRTVLGIAMNGGTESNYSKTLRGEGMVEKGLTEEQMQKAVEMLTEAEKDYVQSTLDAIQEFFPKSDALQQWATGLPLERLPVKQMFRGMGERKGGYYPMMYDRLESKAGELQLSKTMGQLIEPSYRKATTDGGYRKSRVEEFAAPVDFDIDRLQNHMETMIQDLAYRRFLVEANKIVSDPEVRKIFKDHLGEEYVDVPRNWLKRTVNGFNAPSDQALSAGRKFMGALRSNATIVALAGRASTFFVHALSWGGPIAEIGANHFMSGLQTFLRHPRDMWKYVTENSGEMAHFAETQNTHIYQSIQELGAKTGMKAATQRLMFATIGFANMLRAVPTWLGAKEKALKELAAEGKSGDELEKYANLSADRAVRLSIGAGGAKDLPAIMSKDAEAWRLITMFHTPGSVLYSQLKRIGHEAGKTKDYGGALFKTIMATVVAGTVHQLVKGQMPDESKDEGYGEWWLKNQALYPLSAIPLGHEVGSGLMDIATGGRAGEFKISPLGQAFDENFRALESGRDFVAGDKEFDEFFFKALKAAGYWMGAPTGQLSITGDYLYDMMNGTADPNDLGEFVHDLLFSRPKDRR